MANSPLDDHFPNHDDNDGYQPDTPPTPNSNLPPQLNSAVRGHGCPGEGCQNIGEGDGGSPGGQAALFVPSDDSDDDRSVDDGRSVNGDEGPEEHLFEVGDLGQVTLRTIASCIARHRRCVCSLGCSCHAIVLEKNHIYRNRATLVDSDTLPSLESTTVEVGDSDRSVTASETSFCTQSTSSSGLVANMHGAFGEGQAPHSRYGANFTRPPIWLSPILELGTEYPPHIHDSDFEDRPV